MTLSKSFLQFFRNYFKRARDWNNEQIIRLIELVRDYPSIWNPENEAHKNKRNQIDAFIHLFYLLLF